MLQAKEKIILETVFMTKEIQFQKHYVTRASLLFTDLMRDCSIAGLSFTRLDCDVHGNDNF